MRIFKAGKYELELSKKTYVMGILNITPDSFSDGGMWNSTEKAIKRAIEMVNQGADIIDIGGQSTRPGYIKITAEEELNRIYDTVKKLVNELKVPISVDTYYSEVAKEVLDLGVSIINDVSGFESDMFKVVSNSDCGCIVMHSNQGNNIKEFFKYKKRESINFGIDSRRLCFDPGIGFFKSYEENLNILRNFDKICIDDCAMLIAASRKRCIGASCGNPDFKDRDAGTIAAHTIAIAKGADIIRVHNIDKAVQAAKVADAIVRRK